MPIKHGLVIAGRLLDSPASEMPRRMDNSCSAVVLTIFLRMTLQIHSWPAERPNIMFDDETEEANLLSQLFLNAAASNRNFGQAIHHQAKYYCCNHIFKNKNNWTQHPSREKSLCTLCTNPVHLQLVSKMQSTKSAVSITWRSPKNGSIVIKSTAESPVQLRSPGCRHRPRVYARRLQMRTPSSTLPFYGMLHTVIICLFYSLPTSKRPTIIKRLVAACFSNIQRGMPGGAMKFNYGITICK